MAELRARLAAWLCATVLLLGVAGCAPQAVQPQQAPADAAAAPAGFPDAFYRQAAASGEPVYRIDPRHSLVTIEVRRAGTLARFGHDHVVASRDVRGYVAPERRRADLFFSLARLSVDEPGLRAAAGFDTRPSATDIAGTRANMLDKVLEAGRFPWARVQVRGPVPAGVSRDGSITPDSPITLDVSITLHGVTRALQLPVRYRQDAAGLSVRGDLAIRQSDFGITPFSILGGAIRVDDRLQLRFDLRATPG